MLPIVLSKQMETQLLLLLFILKMVSATGEELELPISSPPERVPLNHALHTFEEMVKEEGVIRNFCYKHFFPNVTSLKPEKASNCAELFRAGVKTSGVYSIYLNPANDRKISVYCDMESTGGGWTVFQRRGEFPNTEPRLNFTRSWKDYREGFGNLDEEFWLGNEYIHRLSKQSNMDLLVELMDFEGHTAYALYNTFEVGSSNENYTLTVGNYIGNAGDSMDWHNGMWFATIDFDNKDKCANKRKGGWWFNNCTDANLNGEYLQGKHEQYGKGIMWYKWRGNNYSCKWTEMKMRPKKF